MAILKSNFVPRAKGSNDDLNADDAPRAASPAERSEQESGNDAQRRTGSRDGSDAAPEEGGEISQLRELRDAVRGIFSSSATEIVGAIAVLQQIGTHIDRLKPKAIERANGDHGGSRDDASAGTSLSGQNEASQENGTGGDNPGGFEAQDRSTADLERRLGAASRNLGSRGQNSQEEMRALLEHAISVMETMGEHAANGRLDDLKR